MLTVKPGVCPGLCMKDWMIKGCTCVSVVHLCVCVFVCVSHINMEGQIVAQSLSCVNVDRSLRLSVGAVIKQGSCGQLPVVQHGRHPQI